MLISLNWVKEFLETKTAFDPKQLANQLTLKTAETEKVECESDKFINMVVGLVLAVEKHPNADSLNIATVDVGEKEPLKIVCGGANLKAEMLVAVTKIGAQVKWHGEGDLITIQKTKIRGEESFGMIAAANEIGIEDPQATPKGIMDLSYTKAQPGTSLADLFKKNDTIIEFDNKALTHRPDLWSHYGIAREIAVLTNSQLKPFSPKVTIPDSGKTQEVNIHNPIFCKRYLGVTISNIQIAPSPDWIKEKLQKMGHTPKNNIVDITNYVMLEIGQPLHAFDLSTLNGPIQVKILDQSEKFQALNKEEYDLPAESLVIADKEKTLAVAGVIGGQNSAISESTNTIFIESATFNPSLVRRTSTKIGLRTESVQRFEKSLDPHLAEVALKRAIELINQICPSAKIEGPLVDIKNFDHQEKKVNLSIQRVKSKIGIEIDTSEIKNILEKLSFTVEMPDKNTFSITIPSFRATKDVSMEDDIIEEIARIYGYENIPAILPTLPTKLPAENTERQTKHFLRDLMAFGLGFNEVYNYSLYGIRDIKNSQIAETGHIEVINYLSEDQTHLRTSMIPGILKNLQLNNKSFTENRIFELGRTYHESAEFFPTEIKTLIAGISYKDKSQNSPFIEAKGCVETILEKLNIKNYHIAEKTDNIAAAHPYQSITYINGNGLTLAQVFTLHPVIAKNYDLEKCQVAIFELNLQTIFQTEKIEPKYRPISKFPKVTFDVSIITEKQTQVGTLIQAIKKPQLNLIKEVELFDIFSGASIGENQKAVAFKITLQSDDHTLTEEEIKTTQEEVFKNIEATGGKIRGR